LSLYEGDDTFFAVFGDDRETRCMSQSNGHMAAIVHKSAALGMMASGILLGFACISHPHLMPPSVIASNSWVFIHAAFLISLVVGLLGTTGLYSRSMERTGLLGLIAYLTLFVDIVLIAGLDYYETFIAPHLAREFPMVIEKYGAGDTMGPVAIAFPVSGALTVIGFALLGLANLRTGAFGRARMIFLIVTAIIFGVGLSLLGTISVAQAGAALFGVALVWTDWSYWRDVTSG
jgi:hypothetical protein